MFPPFSRKYMCQDNSRSPYKNQIINEEKDKIKTQIYYCFAKLRNTDSEDVRVNTSILQTFIMANLLSKNLKDSNDFFFEGYHVGN